MIHMDIPKFMRMAGVQMTSEKVSLREQGIESYLSKKLSEDEIIALVKLYYTENCSEEILNDFVLTFKEVDNTFSDDLTNEIQLLAGLILCEIIEQNKWKDLIPVLEIYAQTYEFTGCISVCAYVSNIILNDFDERRIQKREENLFNENKIKLLNKNLNLKGTSEDQEEIEYNADVANNIGLILSKVNELINQVNNANQIQNENIEMLREESQILWWLLSGYSDILKKKYSEVEPKQAAIIIGKELADCVSMIPGPFPIKNLLVKTFDFVDSYDSVYSLDEYIESLDDEIIEKLIEDENVDTPILFALKKKAENGEGNWITVFSRKFSFEERKYSIIDVAYETYLECILLHNSNE